MGVFSLYTHLEDYIYNLFKLLEIKEPKDLTIEKVSKKLGLTVTYKNKAYRFENEINIQKSTKMQEWLDFTHEVCHYLRHCGSQVSMHPLFRQLQEYQADYFAYHFCVPTFMLEKIKEVSIYEIMNQFNVEYEFAVRRFEMYQNRQIDYNLNHTVYLIAENHNDGTY